VSKKERGKAGNNVKELREKELREKELREKERIKIERLEKERLWNSCAPVCAAHQCAGRTGTSPTDGLSARPGARLKMALANFSGSVL